LRAFSTFTLEQFHVRGRPGIANGYG